MVVVIAGLPSMARWTYRLEYTQKREPEHCYKYADIGHSINSGALSNRRFMKGYSKPLGKEIERGGNTLRNCLTIDS